MRRRAFIALGGAALASGWASPVNADQAEGCGGPATRDNGWPVAAIDDDKLVDQDYSPQAFQLQYGIFRDVLRAIPPPA